MQRLHTPMALKQMGPPSHRSAFGSKGKTASRAPERLSAHQIDSCSSTVINSNALYGGRSNKPRRYSLVSIRNSVIIHHTVRQAIEQLKR